MAAFDPPLLRQCLPAIRISPTASAPYPAPFRLSALTYFLAQFSQINGLLDLSHSEARCAYHINKSEIGYLVAKRTGFGTAIPPPSYSSENYDKYYDWRQNYFTKKNRFPPYPRIQRLLEPTGCVNEFHNPNRAEFFIFDSKIKSSLCISEFKWLAHRDTSPFFFTKEFKNPDSKDEEYLRTNIAINGDEVGKNLIIDLWPAYKGPPPSLDSLVSPKLHTFEAIGLNMGALIIDFSDTRRRHVTTIDGLVFDRIYQARASCEFGGSDSPAPPNESRKFSIIEDFREPLELPEVEHVLNWLAYNKIGSTQPYTAFAEAFHKVGIDNSRILVAREDREVCGRAANWLPAPIIAPFCPEIVERESRAARRAAREAQHIESASPDSSQKLDAWKQMGNFLEGIGNLSIDLAQLLFRGGLWALADHGYRPGKVLFWAAAALGLYWIVFISFLNLSVTRRAKQHQQR